jgi:hypothetical protein
MASLTNLLALAAFALVAFPAMVSSMTLQSESSPMVSPFMTATMVRDLFDDEAFVFDFNPLMDPEMVDELGG